ncbi:hypothetical protein, variant [Verruconis gallopava]|uniref:DUF7820 domain-containing protein n=1 Tax=Verruconis gallopava TaxID=253628 RepID=A0A0D2BA23_9PEZI|nr:uncharacterized protein PV09_01050 [Verruconis gallopava]XP_016217984.1 hypothetical protein, variant [Verruconis gallopava]KIW08114.1 hypothetical protein PV09_01050 [Verruconis gallopava]KIW08115.1 hypothetical protein, variant [Verruconis gallopava]
MASPSRQRASATAEPNPNVFDDEYEVDVPEAELDHRPLDRSTRQEADTPAQTRSHTPSNGSRTERRSIVNKEANESNTQQRTWRRSIAKDPRDFATAGSGGTRTPGDNHSLSRHRPMSTASEFAPFEDRSSTPVNGRNASVDGFSGFSQSGLPRSSFASHSPSRRQSSNSRARPAQPYALYNQTGFAADDDDGPVPPLPVGFLGGRDNFERRIGPDGEEQDIVGPDGHTEQLPPYSKYPDGHTKIAVDDAAAIPAGTRILSPILPSPTSPIVERAQRTPALEAAALPASSSGSDSSLSEKKPWKEKTFTEKRRTKVCGGCIPLWMVVTVVVVIVICTAVIGGVVGGLLSAESKRNPPTVTVTSTASMLDASPIPTPKGIAPIASGLYNMPFGIPQEQQKSCLTNPNQYNAWTCNTPPQPALLKVDSPPSAPQFMEMFPNRSVASSSSSSGAPRYEFNYGAQYPTVTTPQRLYWVIDVEEPNLGPALHFQTMYDKLVILDSDQFSPSKAKAKRDQEYGYGAPVSYSSVPAYTIVGPPYYATPAAASSSTSYSIPTGDPHHRKNSVSVGDQPWFCWWNQTWLEGFVYMNSYVGPSQTHLTKREAGPEPTQPPAHGMFHREANTPDAGYPDARDLWRRAIAEYGKRMASSTSTNTSSSSYISSTPTPSSAPPFPYTMKVQERRIPCEQTVQPYCQRMVIPESGPPQPLLDSSNNPVIVPISEDSPSFQVQQNELKSSAAASGKSKRDTEHKQLAELFRRDASQNSCHCVWMSSPSS